jgi:HlyD family secretion protein
MNWLVRYPGAFIALLLLVAAAIVTGLRARGPSVPATLVTRANLEQHVVASGRVWVPTRVSISAQVPGLVIAVGAVEGQRVRAGDLLVQIDDAETRAAVAQAKAAVDQAAARVQQLRKVGVIVATETYRQAETHLERAQAELARSERLAASHAVAQTALEEARRSVEIARAQKTAAQAQQISAAPMGADSRVALSALLQSQAQLAAASVRLEQTRIVVRQDGLILARTVEPGDVVQPARTLLVMAADGDSELVIEPDERNLAWIRIGQKARASADAYPQEVFDAEVSYIAPSIDPQRGSVEVRLRVRAPDFLKPDMTVSVDLTVASKRGVLTLPSEAIRGASTPTPWVFVVAGGRAARRDVKLGIHGAGRTEIAKGLVEGIEVLLPESQALVPGQRVRSYREVR